jgi:hypothetical protein
MTIAQIVFNNERSFGYNDKEVHNKVRKDDLTGPNGLDNMLAVDAHMGGDG